MRAVPHFRGRMYLSRTVEDRYPSLWSGGQRYLSDGGSAVQGSQRAIFFAAFVAAATPDFSRIAFTFARASLGSWRTAAM
jgi:hypothetical protein